MSLEHAILGFLNYQPYTGYDLKKIFDASVQHFWSADQSQIYRTLGKLEEQELVKMEKVAQEDRPDRKVYHITPKGKEELLRWLAGPPLMGAPHSSPLVQVFFGGLLPDEELLIKFEGFAQMMRAVLAQYEQVPESIETFKKEIPSRREHYFWMLTLDNGIRNMRANLEWVENIIQQIKNGEVPQEQE
ncbi:MAG TPA: PadR family transcriptional regulator [Anaerolineaceae bacterium]|nr:PadR family transcriptional regulator [Anaerolineaceae bacterium]